jgi:hypothetical protein
MVHRVSLTAKKEIADSTGKVVDDIVFAAPFCCTTGLVNGEAGDGKAGPSDQINSFDSSSISVPFCLLLPASN